MKNISVLFTVITVLLFSSPSYALLGNYNTSQSFDNSQSDLQSAVNKSSVRVKALETKTGTLSNKLEANTTATNNNTGAITTLATNVGKLADADDKTADAVTIIGGKVDATSSKFDGLIGKLQSLGQTMHTDNVSLKDAISGSFSGLLISMIILATVVTLVVGVLFWRRNRNAKAVAKRMDEGFAAMRTGFATMGREHEEMPDRVALAVHTLNSAPFDYEESGYKGTYQSPIEGINEGYYLELHVPANETGDASSYDRHHETNRAIAVRNFRKTMRLYHSGKFDAPEYRLQKELIELLSRPGGAITSRKIS